MTQKLNEAEQWLEYLREKNALEQWTANITGATGVGSIQAEEWVKIGLESLHAVGFNWAKTPEGEKFWLALSKDFTKNYLNKKHDQ